MEGNHQLPVLWMQKPNISDENEDGSLKDEYFNRELPPGYRFEPTDEELMICYLMRKVKNQPLPPHKIRAVNLHEFSPEELTGSTHPLHREEEWFFFSSRNRKYRNGVRPDRGARHGFWKPTGTALGIKVDGIKIGSRKTLDYYAGSYKTHQKTDWKMHEYVLEEDSIRPNNKRDKDGMMLNEWVLCKIYKSNRNKQSNNGRVQREHQANNGSLQIELQDGDEGLDVDGSDWQHNDEDIAHLDKPNSWGLRETSVGGSTSILLENTNRELKEPEPNLSLPFDPLIYNKSGLLQEVITSPFLKNASVQMVHQANNGSLQMELQAGDEGLDVDGSDWQHNDEDIAHLDKPNSLGVTETSLGGSTSTFLENTNQEPKPNLSYPFDPLIYNKSGLLQEVITTPFLKIQEPKEPEPNLSYPVDPLIYNKSGLLQEVITAPFLKNQPPERCCEPQNIPPLRSDQSLHAEDQHGEGTMASYIWDINELIANFVDLPKLTADDWAWLYQCCGPQSSPLRSDQLKGKSSSRLTIDDIKKLLED